MLMPKQQGKVSYIILTRLSSVLRVSDFDLSHLIVQQYYQ